MSGAASPAPTLRAVDPAEDARIRPGQCGATETIAGAEFICVADQHDAPGPGPWSLDRALAAAQQPLARLHFLIRRYPRRD